ncbi:hypothetical protein B0J17DRAFT_721877 [Rhizoctonia solani]|nr:hypothetical protein B0J17DRAFT_721877 [Rhizoctonia solani]
MSASKAVRKKTFDPPRVPLANDGGSGWVRGAGHGRSQRLPWAAVYPTPPRDTCPRANSVYPTPEPSVRSPSVGDILPPRGEMPLRAPNFQSATHPQEVEEPYLSDSEKCSGSNSDSSSSSSSSSSSDSEDSDSDKDTEGLSADKPASESDEDEESSEEESSKEESSVPPPVTQN